MHFATKNIRRFSVAISLLVLITGGIIYYSQHSAPETQTEKYKTAEEADVYVRFDMEAYDKIKQSYWKTTTDTDLSNLFQLSLQKALSSQVPPALASSTRLAVAQMLASAFTSATSTNVKKNLALNVVTVALYNLPPAGRDGLLSSVQETALRQEVANVNPEKDLYSDLNVKKGANVAEVNQAYEQKKTELAKATTTQAKAELEKVTYAHKVLTSSQSKALYDTSKIEPTIFSHTIGKTLYLNISKISPTTLQEFAQSVDNASTTAGLDSMIVDLRGNIGGALDFAPAFLGLFVGPNQYAFDFFRQDNYLPQRTTMPKFEELGRYTDIAFLTDNMTQSTAEVMTAMFKRFNLGHIVGGTTRGWGTVENTVPLETVIDPSQKFSMLLVQYITLRDDGQPIEGRGVDPQVNIGSKNWKNDLSTYFHSPSLIDALKKSAVSAPLK